MIVKGKPRSGPGQLAAYLMRSDERATLIELHDGGQDLRKAFLAWHAIGEATRGEKTLYHAQIAPETRYPMTPEQWKRAAAILAEELGMAQHPRAIVVHDGGDKPHAHVVFQRADADTMTLWDDSFNFNKHERASQRMEREFGMEPVPGKHAKRDREKQPEFPRAKLTPAEAQREKRTGLSKEQRVAQITDLYRAADSGPALKAALEDAGYVLAQGARGYLVVDQSGGQSVLTRNTGLKKKELEAFMAAVPLDTLPDVDAAKAMQKDVRQQQSNAPAAQPQGATPEAVPVAEQTARSKFVPELAAIPPAPKGADAKKVPETVDTVKQKPAPATPEAAPRHPEIDKLEQALAARQAQEARKLAAWHRTETSRLAEVLDREFTEKLDNLKALQQAERDRFARDNKLEGIEGFIDAVQRRINPGLWEERKQARQQKWDDLAARQKQERADYLTLFKQEKARELEDLRDKHAQQQREQDRKFAEEKARYMQDAENAARIRAELEAARREQERLQKERGREQDPPRRGK